MGSTDIKSEKERNWLGLEFGFGLAKTLNLTLTSGLLVFATFRSFGEYRSLSSTCTNYMASRGPSATPELLVSTPFYYLLLIFAPFSFLNFFSRLFAFLGF